MVTNVILNLILGYGFFAYVFIWVMYLFGKANFHILGSFVPALTIGVVLAFGTHFMRVGFGI
jgi:hypothetical protein